MAIVFASLLIAALAAIGLARHLRGDLARVRYLAAATKEPALAVGHLSLRWRTLVGDARLLRVTLEGVDQACEQAVLGISQDLQALLSQAERETSLWVAQYQKVIEAEPMEELALRQRVDRLAALSQRWSPSGPYVGHGLAKMRKSVAQAVEILQSFERDSAFLTSPYR